MPVLLIARDLVDLASPSPSRRRKLLIQVSDAARRRVEHTFGTGFVRFDRRALPHLERLAAIREYDSEIALVVGAVERHGEVFARFL